METGEGNLPRSAGKDSMTYSPAEAIIQWIRYGKKSYFVHNETYDFVLYEPEAHDEIIKWINENLTTADITPSISFVIVGICDEKEAMLFRMTWASEVPQTIKNK